MCIENKLMEIAPFPLGYFDHFLLEPLLQNHMTSGAKLFMHYNNRPCWSKFRMRSSYYEVCRSK